ncbi:MAG: hypothetical protein ABFS10_14755 [Bacteroidota bacterium]
METIQLPEDELTEMIQFYKEEYDRTSRKLMHITSILKRLGEEIPEPGAGEFITLKSPAMKSGTSKPKKKAGRKSKWELLIIKRLRQLDKPVTYDELTDEIMAFTKLPAGKRGATKQAIVSVIFRLRSKGRKVDTFSIGKREKYVALKSWFSSPGVIKKEYAARIDLPKGATNTGKRKAGRPRKVVIS